MTGRELIICAFAGLIFLLVFESSNKQERGYNSFDEIKWESQNGSRW